VAKFFRYGASGGAGPLNVNLGPTTILSRKLLELEVEINKTITYVVKYLLRVRKFFR